MKLLALILATTALTAHAQSGCGFGQNTWELDEQFETSPDHFVKGEVLRLSKAARLDGLLDYEKIAISQVLGDLREFSMNDGYLTYFAHVPSGRQFVQVGHYPGDDEFGAVFEISVRPEGTSLGEQLALIANGDYTECGFR